MYVRFSNLQNDEFIQRCKKSSQKDEGMDYNFVLKFYGACQIEIRRSFCCEHLRTEREIKKKLKHANFLTIAYSFKMNNKNFICKIKGFKLFVYYLPFDHTCLGKLLLCD